MAGVFQLDTPVRYSSVVHLSLSYVGRWVIDRRKVASVRSWLAFVARAYSMEHLAA